MDSAFTLVVLVVAVVCVLAATRPSRPSERRRESPPEPGDGSGPASHGETGDGTDVSIGPARRWERSDLARAFAVDLVAPGAEGERWPRRDRR